jgi:hypothetical protein
MRSVSLHKILKAKMNCWDLLHVIFPGLVDEQYHAQF